MKPAACLPGLALSLMLLVAAGEADSQPGRPPQKKAQAAATTAARLTGEWANTDPKTRGITRLSIVPDQNGQTLRVLAWGACEPVECDWGPTALHLLADGESEEFTYAFATWESAVGTKHLVLKLDGEALTAENYALSRRSPLSHYRETLQFRRSSPAPNPEPPRPRRRR